MSYWLYLLFTISYFVHLPSRIPELGQIRFDFVLMALTLLFLLLEGHHLFPYDGHCLATSRLLRFILFVLVTIPFVEWPGSVIRSNLAEYAKVVMFYFFTVSIIKTETRLKGFLSVFLACQVFRILEPTYLHVTTGYWGSGASYLGYDNSFMILRRLSGAPDDVVNPNQFAAVINTTLPFLYYLGIKNARFWRLLILPLFPISLYAEVLTGSRSGILSLIVLVVAVCILSQHKLRAVAIAAVFLVPISLLVAQHMGPDLADRYLSIIDRSKPHGEGASKRLRGQSEALSVALSRPLFGYGLGTSMEFDSNILRARRPQKPHNLYFETLLEVGIVGFVFFATYLHAICLNGIQAKRFLHSGQPRSFWLMNLVLATQVWIIMDLFYSFSVFGLTSWEWYLFGGISTVCLRLAEHQHLAETRKGLTTLGVASHA